MSPETKTEKKTTKKTETKAKGKTSKPRTASQLRSEASAKARHADPRGQFVHGMSAHEIADYTIVSGTYNMHMGADAEEWVEYTQDSTVHLRVLCRSALLIVQRCY